MTVNDNATLVVGSGNFFTAPTSTALPDDLTAITSPWVAVGHTSLEDIFAATSDGGDATVLGTLQNKSLRTTYSARTETMSFTVQQFDTPSLKLFYGSNAPTLANGMVGVPANPTPTTCAWLAVFVDGDNIFAMWAPKAEIYRGDDLSISDTSSLAGLPLGVTPLVDGSNAYTYAVTPLGDIPLATTATAGAPGAFTPDGDTIPADLTALQASDITASPATVWDEGDYVELGDDSHAYWTGSAWAEGEAPAG